MDLLVDDDSGSSQQGLVAPGDGTFFGSFLQTFVAYSADSADAVALDLNRDGYDEGVAVLVDDTYQVLGNTNPGSNGVTNAGTPLPTSGAPLVATPGDGVSGDWNGDGKPDLAITHSGVPEGIGLHLGNDTLTPTAVASRFGVGAADPDRIATADFDHDGDADLIVGSSVTAGGVHLFLGDGLTNGGGSGVSAVQSVPWARTVVAVAVADFDLDGQPDVVAASDVDLQVFLNDGDAASFTPAGVRTLTTATTAAVTVADFNRDGRPDLVLVDGRTPTGTFASMIGNGDGTFATPVYHTTLGGDPRDVRVADLNGDGFPDAVFTEDDDQSVQILRGNGTGFDPPLVADSLATAQTRADGVRVGDVNGDGRPDLVVEVHSGPPDLSQLEVFLNQGGFVFTRVISPLATLHHASEVDLGDIDRDGNLDAVMISHNEGLIEIMEGNGDGTFTSRGTLAAADGRDVALADLDKDGDLDLIQTVVGLPGVVSYANTDPTNFTFGTGQSRTSAGSPKDLALGDLNRDGEVDSVAANDVLNGGIHVYFGE